ncbi:hypothetical protein J5X84_14830 [Streptosporangiaceae bacterium NEAU-GS5]|nr:hypothetical protein [Streptosporangiaceae bacterium NEAU-GS5]
MSYREVLRMLLAELGQVSEPWVISGSAALALHGLPVTPADIDVESTAAGAGAIGVRLSAFEIQPVRFSGTILLRSHFGRFLVGGMPVEVIGDLRIRGRHGWSEPFGAGRAAVRVQTEFGPVPVAARDALAAQYAALGRPDRARLVSGEGPR